MPLGGRRHWLAAWRNRQRWRPLPLATPSGPNVQAQCGAWLPRLRSPFGWTSSLKPPSCASRPAAVANRWRCPLSFSTASDGVGTATRGPGSLPPKAGAAASPRCCGQGQKGCGFNSPLRSRCQPGHRCAPLVLAEGLIDSPVTQQA